MCMGGCPKVLEALGQTKPRSQAPAPTSQHASRHIANAGRLRRIADQLSTKAGAGRLSSGVGASGGPMS